MPSVPFSPQSSALSTGRWEFWIDVGGTFTDCIARSPDDELIPYKVLSSGVTKGTVAEVTGRREFRDPLRQSVLDIEDSVLSMPPNFWSGYELRFLDEAGQPVHTSRVTGFDPQTGTLHLDADLPSDVTGGTAYELTSGEEAPILAIRYVLGLRLDEPIPPAIVRLGTTRGTNALLTRTGARTAFVTTQGFADVLLIGYQNRPRLFDLAIHKPQPLFERVIEIDERLAADGTVLKSPVEEQVRRQLAGLQESGIESVGICLLHAFANPEHERLVERMAREVGFEEISTSSRVSPLIKIVSRGDTTVVDAYLNPVLRDYVNKLRASLTAEKTHGPLSVGFGDQPSTLNPQPSTLKIMTSAGGLVDADRFVGKDSILSGPAGGVIGFSRVAERAGFEKSIGFDMGGTSTDVSRFDGSYELEFETEKAGVRIVSPMLAIETVAAGGGSVCHFDGVKLAVGPHSAGADPGPACYGRGGPLTVTDVNLYLGKILPSHFPFPLNRQAVERRLETLCAEIAESPLGKRYTPVELAEGFVQIANQNMVRAIRKISVAKGYDPADYVLVTFGGAGAQHACAMARLLGMTKVLVHPFAGILSAYGIGLADVRRFGERAVLKPYTEQTRAELEPLFEQLESSVRDEVLAEGIPPEQIDPPTRSLEMRYHGVEATIHVVEPDDGDYVSRYETLHEQLYGYRHTGRAVEVTAARVEVVGRMPEPPVHTSEPVRRVPQPHETTVTWFEGRWHTAGVFLREELKSGDAISGPAILCEPTSTVVIDPGFSATITERGEVLIEEGRESRVESPEPSPPVATRGKDSSPLVPRPSSLNAPDPVLLEIFNNLFASIAEQMGVTLQRTSISTNVKERLDFSCAIFSPTGNLVVNAPHIPVHLGAMSETVKRIIADNPHMAPGDVFVTNDPYRGGSHLPDVTVITPVFGDSDEPSSVRSRVSPSKTRPLTGHGSLLFFTASRAHHAEIGGVVPGSMPPFSKNLAEEGVLIRNFRLIDEGKSREEALRKLLLSPPFPSRAIEDNLADIRAQVAANNTGVRLLNELVERYSLPVVQAYMGHIQRAAAEKMRMALANIPDGTYSMTDHLDDGSPIAVTIAIEGDKATVDFTGTGPVLQTNLNANRAIVTAAVLYVFRCLIAEDIPLNSGVLEPVEIVLPECLLNPPERDDPTQCPAVVGGNVETSQRVVDVLLGALKVAAASQGTMNNLTFGDETFGYYETICGGSGATGPSLPSPGEPGGSTPRLAEGEGADGADAVHTHMTNTRLTDVEVLERRYPVRVLEFSIRKGSGGKSDPNEPRPLGSGAASSRARLRQHRGGDGVIRKLEFLKPLQVSMLSERRGPYPPFGLNGGAPGALGHNLLQRPTQHSALSTQHSPLDLGGKFAIDVAPGDVLIIETPGGGACGR